MRIGDKVDGKHIHSVGGGYKVFYHNMEEKRGRRDPEGGCEQCVRQLISRKVELEGDGECSQWFFSTSSCELDSGAP